MEAGLVIGYLLLLLGTYGCFIYQTVLLYRIAKNTSNGK